MSLASNRRRPPGASFQPPALKVFTTALPRSGRSVLLRLREGRPICKCGGERKGMKKSRSPRRKRKNKRAPDNVAASGRVQVRQTDDETTVEAETSGLPPRDLVLVVALVVVLLVTLTSVALAHK